MKKLSYLTSKPLAVAILAATLSACGGQQASDTTQSPPVDSTPQDLEPEAAAFEVVYPMAYANLGTGLSETFTTVAVRTLQPTTSVEVNGASLETDLQDPSLWYGRVAINYGDNLLDIVVSTDDGTFQEQRLLSNTSIQLPILHMLRVADDGTQYLVDASGRFNQRLVDNGELRPLGDEQCGGLMMEVSAGGDTGYVLDGVDLCVVDLSTGSSRHITVLQDDASDDVRNSGFYLDENALYISRSRQNTSGTSAFEIVRMDIGDYSISTLFRAENIDASLSELRALAVDGDTSIAYYYDFQGTISPEKDIARPALMALDLVTGQARVVTAMEEGPFRAVLNGDGTLTTYNYLDQPLENIDLQSGVRTARTAPDTQPPSQAVVGSGPRFLANSLALGAAGENLYATSADGLFRVSLATGERDLLAPMNCDDSCEIEIAGGYAYVFEGERASKAIYKVDLADGHKALLGGPNSPNREGAAGAAVDVQNNRLLVANFWGYEIPISWLAADYGYVFSVDLATGDKSNFWWDPSSDTSHYLDDIPADVWMDNDNQCLYVWYASQDRLVAVDTSSPSPAGPGRVIDVSFAARSHDLGRSSMVIDKTRHQLYLTNRADTPLIRLPLEKPPAGGCYRADYIGHMEKVSGGGLGSGIDLPSYYSVYSGSQGNVTLALDGHNQVAYMVGRQGDIVAVSLLTGDRVVIAN